MNNPSPRSHVQNHPKRSSNPWVFLTPKLYHFREGGFRIPHDEGGSRQVISPEIIFIQKNLHPWKITPGWIGKSSEPNPPWLSSMLIFQDLFSTVRSMSWFHWSQLKSQRVAIFSICLPVLLVSVLLLRNPGSHRSQKKYTKIVSSIYM